ncbi:MAG: hypothetical protein AAGF45_00435 [Pseudomonadota bacterium]
MAHSTVLRLALFTLLCSIFSAGVAAETVSAPNAFAGFDEASDASEEARIKMLEAPAEMPSWASADDPCIAKSAWEDFDGFALKELVIETLELAVEGGCTAVFETVVRESLLALTLLSQRSVYTDLARLPEGATRLPPERVEMAEVLAAASAAQRTAGSDTEHLMYRGVAAQQLFLVVCLQDGAVDAKRISDLFENFAITHGVTAQPSWVFSDRSPVEQSARFAFLNYDAFCEAELEAALRGLSRVSDS